MLTAVYIQERKQNQYDNHQHPFHSGGHLHPPALIRPGICLQYAVFRQGHLLRREIQERQQDQRHSSMRTLLCKDRVRSHTDNDWPDAMDRMDQCGLHSNRSVLCLAGCEHIAGRNVLGSVWLQKYNKVDQGSMGSARAYQSGPQPRSQPLQESYVRDEKHSPGSPGNGNQHLCTEIFLAIANTNQMTNGKHKNKHHGAIESP